VYTNQRAARIGLWGLLLVAAAGVTAMIVASQLLRRHEREQVFSFVPLSPSSAPVLPLSPFQDKLVSDLQRQVRTGIRYKNGYYAGGEPPADIGVCTDVVIRSFRAAGVDLHQTVAADIRAHPRPYRIIKPDANIDHRRCSNLVVFFRRHAHALPATGSQADWQPGDIVFWDTWGNGKVDHVGMIGTGHDGQGNPTVIHHWPGLPVSETDGLYHFAVCGHFRWQP
jgi:uncharacterized protein YijF (DUF1287 family)